MSQGIHPTVQLAIDALHRLATYQMPGKLAQVDILNFFASIPGLLEALGTSRANLADRFAGRAWADPVAMQHLASVGMDYRRVSGAAQTTLIKYTELNAADIKRALEPRPDEIRTNV